MVFHAFVSDVKDDGQARVGVQGAAENEYADRHKGELPAASISATIPDFFPPVRAIRGCGITQVLEARSRFSSSFTLF